ncbi:25167_t:CDS:10 [Racocetra persica]|uniref:25167_t:CDS:1 n=1 Tax=Racocetra persica TaxID=160502 RepID=A0ACA9KFH8_9GLOM|nr:25167_t:CDS:10 [Racocetra persica]
MTYPQGDRKGEIISIHLQKKAYEFINASFNKNNLTIGALELKNKNLNQRLKKLKSSHSLSVQVARAKQSKKKQISKIRSSIRKASKVHPAQFQQEVNKLFRANNNEYNAKFVKLATDINFENFRVLLCAGIESALNGFTKWMETWIHLPLSVCQLGGVDGPEFACAFLNVFFDKTFLRISTLKETLYIKLLKEDLFNGHSNTFELLEVLAHRDFFEEFKKFADSDISELAKFPLIYVFIKFRIWSIVAQLYAVAEASKAETSGGEGVEVIKNEPYDNGRGQYTYKIYHLSSKVPTLLRALAPSGALELYEEAWNAYPHCRTVLTNGYMKENFKLVTETMHIDKSRGEVENALNISQDLLEKRQIVIVDIANDPVDKKDYQEDLDPTLFHSEKTGRGPLKGDWIKTVTPVMTCYKLVTVEFKWFGLQTKIEAFIQDAMHSLFIKFHRQVFGWTDKWFGMTMEDIRVLEDKTKLDLEESLSKPIEVSEVEAGETVDVRA